MNHINQEDVIKIDSNPMGLITVFSSILMNFAGVFSRSLALAPDSFPRRDDEIDRNQLFELLIRTQKLQIRHFLLIRATNTADKAIYPIGVETLWMSSNQQVDDYRDIRDRSIKIFVETTIQSIRIPQLILSKPEREQLLEIFDVMDHATYHSINSSTFGESAQAVADGIDTAVSFFIRHNY